MSNDVVYQPRYRSRKSRLNIRALKARLVLNGRLVIARLELNQFVAEDGDIARCLDPDPHLIPLHLHDRNPNVRPDPDRLQGLSAEDKHPDLPGIPVSFRKPSDNFHGLLLKSFSEFPGSRRHDMGNHGGFVVVAP
jgi:hypothetical protein